MNEAQLDDLKQFITGTISQTERRLEKKIAELRTELRAELRTGLAAVRAEMADGFAGVGEAIELVHCQLDEHITECDKRLTRLEQQAA